MTSNSRKTILLLIPPVLSVFFFFLALRSCAFEPDPAAIRAFFSGHKVRQGRYRHTDGGKRLSPVEMRQVRQDLREKLEALGYATGSVPAGDKSGVSVHDSDRAYKGFNLYCSGHAAEAVLMDMDGRVVHTWSKNFFEVWPLYPVGNNRNTRFFRRVHLLENGHLLAIYEGLGIVRLDADSNLVWKSGCRAHHDLFVDKNGDIYALARRLTKNPYSKEQKPMLEDFVVVLDKNGKEKRRASIHRAFKISDEYSHITRIRMRRYQDEADPFHTNTIKLLDGGIRDTMPDFTDGRLLICLRYTDTVAVMDMDMEKIVWAQTGPYRRQHDAQILENGNMLVFDNLGKKGRSQILEFDPATMDVVWSYEDSEEHAFFTETCGTVQRLENGNTLITESDPGRAFEITPEGETVWEFHNPNRAGENDEFVATLFEVERLEPDLDISWAKNP